MDIAIAGGGAAGLFAALLLARAGHQALVLELLAAGVAEAPLRTQLPDSLWDTAPWPGDERLTAMMTRRSTIDWVLRRAAAAEPGVTVRSAVKVTGLLTAPAGPGDGPRM